MTEIMGFQTTKLTQYVDLSKIVVKSNPVQYLGKIRAVAYFKDNDEFPIENQRKKIQSYCDKYDIDLVRTYTDYDQMDELYSLVGATALDPDFHLALVCEESYTLTQEQEERVGLALGLKSIIFRILGHEIRDAKGPKIIHHRKTHTITIVDKSKEAEAIDLIPHSFENETAALYFCESESVEGLTLDVQKSQMREFCKSKGVSVLREFTGFGSDDNPIRPRAELQIAIGMVIVEDLDFLMVWYAPLLTQNERLCMKMSETLIENGHVIRTYLYNGMSMTCEGKLVAWLSIVLPRNIASTIAKYTGSGNDRKGDADE